MSDREKLIELLGDDVCKYDCCDDCECQGSTDACVAVLKEQMADHLISNGVTVQKWIPVSEPPKEYRDEYGELIPFLVCGKDTEYPYRGLYDGKTWGDGLVSIYPTHWMPLPEPPKECECYV